MATPLHLTLQRVLREVYGETGADSLFASDRHELLTQTEQDQPAIALKDPIPEAGNKGFPSYIKARSAAGVATAATGVWRWNKMS
jgi:hypothetical protein